MKSNWKKRMLAVVLCMVIALSNSSFIFASTGTEEPAAVAQEGDPQNVQEVQTEAAVQDTPAVLSETTPEATPEATPEPTQVPEVTAAPTEAPQATAEPTQAPEVTAAPEATPAPTEMPAVTAAPTQAPEITPTPTPEVTAAPEATPVPTEAPVNEVQQTELQPYHAVYEDNTITITVSAEAGIIPEGAELKVTPIEKKEITSSMTEEEKAEVKAINDQYDLTEKKLTEDSEAKNTTMQGFLAYDISFLVNGQETEPNGDVKVVMDFKEAAVPVEKTAEEVKDTEVSVLHLEEDTNGNIKEVVNMGEANKIETLELGTEQQVKKVELITNSFSSYTLVWTSENKRKVNLSITCINLDTGKELRADKKEITLPSNTDGVSASDIAPSIEGFIYNRAEIKLTDSISDEALRGKNVEFTKLRWQGENSNKLQAYYNGGFKETGCYFKKGPNLDTAKITFYYTDESKGTGTIQFYYVYVTPDDDGTGYNSELIWSGDKLATSDDISGLKQNDKEVLKNRFGFEEGEDKDALSYDQTLTVEGKTWENIEYVGSRVYNSSELDKTAFTDIHEYKHVLENLKRVGSNYQYKTSGGTYQDLTDDESIVILFAHRLDYTRAEKGKYEKAVAAGEITDYSEYLKGDGDVTVNISKSAEWADYYDRLAEITFTVNGTPKIDPLDIVLVIDTSYSMDFSNYDWDYNECSPDISDRKYVGYDRYDRFFEDQSAPNKLTGTSRMEDTQNAAFSFITTFMKNNAADSSTTNNRVAIVEFNGKATNVTNGFTESFDDAISAVENLSTDSGTNTGAAIEMANSIVNGRDDTSRKCVTIVLSDGAPNKEDDNFETQLNGLKFNSTVYSIGVDLSETDTILKGKGYPGEGESPKEFLQSIASDANKAYNVTSGQNMVSDCFEDIINDLTTAATEAKIYDIVGEFFNYDSSTDNAVTADNKNVTIDIGDIGIVDNTVSFTAELDDDKKNLVDAYKTNKNDLNEATNDVYLGYQVGETPESEPVTEDPELNVYREVKVRYYYLDANGVKQPINLKGTSEQDVINYIDDDIDVLKGIEKYASYERLTGDTSTFTVTQDILDKYINDGYGGVYVESDLAEPTENTYTLLNDNTKNVIDVVYYNNDQEDPLYIEVQKTFVGIENPKTDVPDFVIELYDSEKNKLKDLKLNPGESDIKPTVSEDGLTFTWRIVGLEAGTYYVKETGEGKEGYTTTIEVKDDGGWKKVTSESEVSVTTQAPDIQFNGFDKQDNVITSCSSTNPIDGNTNLIAAALTEKAGYFVWTKDTLSAAEREEVVDAIKRNAGHNFNNMTVEETKFFSTTEKIEDGLNFRGGVKIERKDGNTSLNFNSTDQWSMVCYANYTEVPGINAEIEIKNTYTPDTMDVDLKKFMSNFTTPLTGAKFSLYTGKMDSSQSKIAWDSEPTENGFEVLNANDQIELTGLQSGYYKLVETEAPQGYLKLTQPIIFKLDTVNKTIQFVDEAGTTISTPSEMWKLNGNCIEIKNNILYDLPSSGGSGIFWYLISGTAFLMAASLILYRMKRKEVLGR